jgi:predicted Zn-dependent protease
MQLIHVSQRLRDISDNVAYACRMEIEADYIGILLLGAAGFHPQWALVFIQNSTIFETGGSLTHPSPKKRLQLLSEAKTMKEAMELYREVAAMDKVTEMYFR